MNGIVNRTSESINTPLQLSKVIGDYFANGGVFYSNYYIRTDTLEDFENGVYKIFEWTIYGRGSANAWVEYTITVEGNGNISSVVKDAVYNFIADSVITDESKISVSGYDNFVGVQYSTGAGRAWGQRGKPIVLKLS